MNFKKVRNALMSLHLQRATVYAKSHTTKPYWLAVQNNKNDLQDFAAIPELLAVACEEIF